jgi:hypothetical protein
MRLALSVAFLCAIGATPARGAHCPQGQLWRVHLRECVPLRSPLALAYAGRAQRRIKIAPFGHAAPRPAPDPPDPAVETLLIPLLEAAGHRWRVLAAPAAQPYPARPEGGPWPPLSPCCDQ